MTPEFPALRESLVRAAARRRRRRLTIRAAVPAVALAALAVFLVPRGVPDREREVAPQQRSALQQSFAVFRRPHNDGDRLPQGVSVPGAMDRENARRLAFSGPDSFFAVPTVIAGRPSLCLVRHRRGAGSNLGCSSLREVTQESKPHGFTVGGFVALLFVDGTTDLMLTTKAGGSWLAPAGNVLFQEGDLERVSWTGPSGTRFYFGTPAKVLPPPQGCVGELGKLPPNATEDTARIALRRAEEIYPGVRSATVTAVKRPPGTPCSAAVTRRTLEVDLKLDRGNRKSASLAQGRLLAGVVGGELQVYYVMH